MVITLVEPCLILLIGASGSGKSTFAQRHFQATQILSSDFCRALVSDDPSDQSVTDDAFELLHLILAKRLRRGRTTVVDATNVQISSRQSLSDIARQNNMPVIAMVFALPEEICLSRNQQHTNRQVPADVIRQQRLALTIRWNIFSWKVFKPSLR